MELLVIFAFIKFFRRGSIPVDVGLLAAKFPDGLAALHYEAPGFGEAMGGGPVGKLQQLPDLFVVNLFSIEGGRFGTTPVGDDFL